MLAGQRFKLDFEGEATQRSLINSVEQVRGADENALEALHALQHFVNFGDLVAALRERAILQKTVGLVEQQHGFFLLRFLEHRGHLLFGFTDVFTHQIACFFDDQRSLHGFRHVFAKCRFPGAWHAVEADRTCALILQCCNNFFDGMSRLDVEQ